MSLGRRKARNPRAQLRPTIRPNGSSRDRTARRPRWPRLAVVAISVVVMSGLLYGMGQPLIYRVGQVPTRDIRVRVPSFQVKNQRKTNVAVQEANDRVVAMMVNDPALLEELKRQLIDLTDAVSKAGDRSELPENLRLAWEVDQATFEAIKDASDTPERREDLKRRLGEAFTGLLRDGVLGPDTLPRDENQALSVEVRPADDSAGPHLVSIDRVRPERIVKVDGPVSQEFVAAFSNVQLGQRLFAMVADKVAGTPTLAYDEQTTSERRSEARAAIKDVYDTYQRGDLLVEQGQTLTEDHLTLLRLEHEAAQSLMAGWEKVQRFGSALVLVGALSALLGYYILSNEPKLAASLQKIAALCGLLVLAVLAARLVALQPWDAELIPLALAAMILAIAYNPHLALMVAFTLSLIVCLALGTGLGHFLVLVGGTAAGVLPLSDVRSRTKPIQVGLAAALGYFVLTWAVGLWQNQPLPLIAADSGWRALWGLMAGFFLGGLLPFVENSFGIVTGISLLELGDINHPLLQELVRRAPGTHNHSVTVGTIAESAADRIGANGLLVRVGAYFHDIGKMLKPHYFIENQTGTNRHANLAPAMSTLIIIGHVKDGSELARQHNLPDPIIDLIEQHHGTTLVEYFYREARNRCDGNPDATVSESSFRYPGPKPQTREAGILMLADAVESASRTLSEPTPGRIEGLVSSIVERRLQDEQFDDCGLTLREIAEVRDSLTKSLIGIYHGRVKYPDQKTA